MDPADEVGDAVLLPSGALCRRLGAGSGIAEGIVGVVGSGVADEVEVDAVDGVALGNVGDDGEDVIVDQIDAGAGPEVVAWARGHRYGWGAGDVLTPGVAKRVFAGMVVVVGAVGEAVEHLWGDGGGWEETTVAGGWRLPGGIDVDVGMDLKAGSVSAVDHIGQRIPAGVDAERGGDRAGGEAGGPGLQIRGVVGVPGGTNLEEDGVEAGGGDVGDEGVDVLGLGRALEGGPVEAGDPDGASLGDGGRRRGDERQVGPWPEVPSLQLPHYGWESRRRRRRISGGQDRVWGCRRSMQEVPGFGAAQGGSEGIEIDGGGGRGRRREEAEQKQQGDEERSGAVDGSWPSLSSTIG